MMEFFERLLFGSSSLWGGGVAHSVLILALVIAFGIMLGKVKVAGVSLGVTGILFAGIVFGHFGLGVESNLLHFLKEFGLILFVYSVGLQVGPGFFASFRTGGVTLNKLAVIVVSIGVAVTVGLYWATGLPVTTMAGIMSGAVTNTPGLGAAPFSLKHEDMKILLYGFSESYARRAAERCEVGFCLSFEEFSDGDCLLLQCPLLDEEDRLAFFERMTGCGELFDAVIVSYADAVVQYCSPQGNLFVACESADLVTDMREVKHYHALGVLSRDGIDH